MDTLFLSFKVHEEVNTYIEMTYNLYLHKISYIYSCIYMNILKENYFLVLFMFSTATKDN